MEEKDFLRASPPLPERIEGSGFPSEELPDQREVLALSTWSPASPLGGLL